MPTATAETVLPQDAYNRILLDNAHPTDWTNPRPEGRYNLVVVGGGTAGLVAAAGAAGLGAKVALVESHLLGGDCLNFGCVPSKAVISASRVAAIVRDAHRFGVCVPVERQVDFAAVMERMRRLRADISHHDSAARFRELGVDVFLGEGRFSGPDQLEVEGATLRFSKALIATGARSAVPRIPGLEQVEYLTNETVFSLTEPPRRLGIVGAGPYGRSWTPVNPASVPNYRSAAGLPVQNTGRFVTEGVITDATGVTTRGAIPLHGNPGGLPEIVVPNPSTQIRVIRVSGANPEF